MRALTDGELTAIVGLAAALIGAAVAIAAAWLTNRTNAKVAATTRAHELSLRAEDLRRSRGEELYTLLRQWLNRLYGYYVIKLSVMDGKITYNQALDIELQDRDRSDDSHVRIEMLIDVYFPVLHPQYSKLIQLREEVNAIIFKHKAEYSVGRTDGSAYVKPFQAKLQKLEFAAKTLTDSLLERLRNVEHTD